MPQCSVLVLRSNLRARLLCRGARRARVCGTGSNACTDAAGGGAENVGEVEGDLDSVGGLPAGGSGRNGGAAMGGEHEGLLGKEEGEGGERMEEGEEMDRGGVVGGDGDLGIVQPRRSGGGGDRGGGRSLGGQGEQQQQQQQFLEEEVDNGSSGGGSYAPWVPWEISPVGSTEEGGATARSVRGGPPKSEGARSGVVTGAGGNGSGSEGALSSVGGAYSSSSLGGASVEGQSEGGGNGGGCEAPSQHLVARGGVAIGEHPPVAGMRVGGSQPRAERSHNLKLLPQLQRQQHLQQQQQQGPAPASDDEMPASPIGSGSQLGLGLGLGPQSWQTEQGGSESSGHQQGTTNSSAKAGGTEEQGGKGASEQQVGRRGDIISNCIILVGNYL